MAKSRSAGTEPDLDLSVIIVSWNVRDLLRGCLQSLADQREVRWTCSAQQNEPSSYEASLSSDTALLAVPHRGTLMAEAIVVDNASADGTPAMVAAEFPWVRVIANPDNRGFTRANNQGLAESRGSYVLFLNPDTVITGQALQAMLAYMAAHPAAGVTGPELRYGDGTLQSSRRRFPTFGMALMESTPLAWHWPSERNTWARLYHMDDCPSGTTPQPVDWLVGAALLVRRETLDQIGGFDEGYFMYSEELDWCRRAAGRGWERVYLPGVRIVHYEGRSSDQAVAARHIRFQTSKVRYFRKFHGAWVAGLLRGLILAMFAGEWLLEACKWLAGSRRPLRAGRMAAYGQLLRSGLR